MFFGNKKPKLKLALLAVLIIVSIGFSNKILAFTHDTLSPADNATNVTTTQNLQLTFPYNVIAYSGTIYIYKNDGTLFESFSSWDSQVSGSYSTTITLNPNSNFVEGTSYYVNIDTSFFTDESWMSYYDGISGNTSWNFTVPDVTAPTLSSVTPTDNSVKVITTVNLVMDFSEAIDIQTGNITIKRTSNNAIIETIAVNSAKVTGNGTTQITINPSNGLTAGVEMYVLVDSGAFKDTSGNSYTGISSTTAWSFTTWDGTVNWYNANWAYRQKVKVLHSKVNGDLADFPVMINLANLNSGLFTHAKADGSDIVITDFTGNGTKLSRELESFNAASQTGTIWFKAPNLYNSVNGDFYVYYGYSSASETNSTSTWKSNYQAVSHFTETPTSNDSDSEFQDSTSKNNDAKSKGTMDSSDKVAGQIGNGVDLDGSNDYLDYGNITAVDTRPKGSFSAWFKRAGTWSVTPIFNKGSSSSVIDIFNDSSYYQSTVDNAYSYSTVSVSNNTNWHYLVAVFDGTASGNSGRFKFYIDGVAQSLSYGNVGANLGGSSESLYVGYSNVNWMSYYAAATFDEVHISNGTFSAAWIKTEYDNQNSPSTFYTVSAEESGGPDSTAPTVSSFSPTDGATVVGANDNLTIVFSETIDIQTGNITIKKSADNSTVETISITGGQVTGNGTTTITINPSITFAASTGYYVQIDATAVDDTAGNSYAGISDTTTWNFTTNAWYNSGWSKRIKITVDADYVDADLTNFPVYVNLDDLPDTFFDDVMSTGADIRVTKSDGSSEVAREIVAISRTANTGELWFVANGTLSGTTDTDFYIYYGNGDATEPSASATYGKNKVWVNSYIGVWHINEDPDGGAGSILDSTSSALNGTPTNLSGEDPVTGKIGNTIDLDGSAEYISMGDTSLVDFGTGNFEYSAWAKTDNTGATQIVMAKDSTGGRQFEFRTEPSGTGVRVAYWSGGSAVWKDLSNILSDTSWHYLVFIRRSNSFEFYKDGSLAGSGTTSGSHGSMDATTTALTIGARTYTSFENYFDGRIDEARVSGTAHAAEWHSTSYNNQNSPSTFYSVGSAETTFADSTAPTVSSFSPADGASSASRTANFTITFSETIDIQTGNITIKKASDNSTVETISISGGQVTGNGTTSITIDPSVTLSGSTDYYVQIASGAVKDTAGNSYAGIADTTTWNFTTAMAWYNGNWLYRQKITIDDSKVSSTETNFPVYVNLDDLPDSFFASVKADGGDIRVTNSDGETELPREVVEISTGSKTGELWFKADTLPSTSNSDWYLYYGNSSASEPSTSATYGRNNVWTNGFVGVWHLNSNSGTMPNSTSTSADGTSYGGIASRVAGKAGYALDFDGSNDYIDLGDNASLEGFSSMTESFWMNADSLSGYGVPFGKESIYKVDVESGNHTRFLTGNNWGGTIINSNSTLSTATWYYVVAVNSGSGKYMYINGVQQSQSSSGGSVGSNTEKAGIGGLNAGYVFNGRIDEVRIANTTRSAAWALTEYNNQNSSSTFYTPSSSGEEGPLTPPTVSSFTPADNATGISPDTNLVIVFSKAIDIQTGNITIKKVSDNSTVQTIDVTSGAVTGNGTTTITINPPSNLTASTNYYIYIDATAFDDTSGNSYAGIASSTTWNFGTGSLGNVFFFDMGY